MDRSELNRKVRHRKWVSEFQFAESRKFLKSKARNRDLELTMLLVRSKFTRHQQQLSITKPRIACVAGTYYMSRAVSSLMPLEIYSHKQWCTYYCTSVIMTGAVL